eukprot:jgi/Botrbrau1/6855/Bobra.152_2s0014.1
MMCPVSRSWLPADVFKVAESSDVELFHELVHGLAKQWSGHETPDEEARILALEPWLTRISSCLVFLEPWEPSSEDINLAITTIIDIVVQTGPGVRIKGIGIFTLEEILQKFRKKATLQIPWHPLYVVTRKTFLGPNSTYDGVSIQGAATKAWFRVINRARRFFPSGAAQEIWEEFGSHLQDVHSAGAFEAFFWVVVLMPAEQASLLDGDWQTWVPLWLDIWDQMAESNPWNALFLSLFSHLVKYDINGAVNWEPHLDRLSVHILAAFNVPVGTAVAKSPVSRVNFQVFQSLMGSTVSTAPSSAAKLQVYLFGHYPEGSIDRSLGHFITLSNLLEQYFHPSNTGSWTSDLTSFLEHLTRDLSHRLVRELGPCSAPFKQGPMVGVPVAPPRRALSTDNRRAIVDVVVKWANKAMYSKVESLRSKAGLALATMAYLEPNMVLRLVVERFQEALDTVTAAHQLVSATNVLGLCTRPLLLAGLPTDDLNGESNAPAEHDAAGQVLAKAMMEMLPAIDANDASKTNVAMQFYVGVLSSIPSLEEATSGLPLLTDLWVEELLSRFFAILRHLDEPTQHEPTQVGTKPQHSFLLKAGSMFEPLLHLLFNLIPTHLRRMGIRQVARFVLGNMLPSVADEASVLCTAASWADPLTCGHELLDPLLSQLEAELKTVSKHNKRKGSKMSLSKVQEGSIYWQANMVAATVLCMGPALLPYKARLIWSLNEGFQLPSKVLRMVFFDLLENLLHGLVRYYPLDKYVPWAPKVDSDMLPISPWMDLYEMASVGACPPPTWHIPNQEEIKFANDLIDFHLKSATEQLQVFAQSGTFESGSMNAKEEVLPILQRIKGVLAAVGTQLPYFSGPQKASGDLRVAGSLGPVVGKPGMLEAAAAALRDSAPRISDPDNLCLLAQVATCLVHPIAMTMTAPSSTTDLNLWVGGADAVHEPAVVNIIYPQDGLKRWRIRTPRWLVIEKLQDLCFLRGLRNKSFPFTGRSSLELPWDKIPISVKEVFTVLAGLAMQQYNQVRIAAVDALDTILECFPAMTPVLLSMCLGALVGLPQSPPGLLLDAYDAGAVSPALLLKLLAAGEKACTGLLGPKLPQSAAEAAAEDGRVTGALQILSKDDLRICVCSYPSALAGFLAACLGGLAHTSVTVSADLVAVLYSYVTKFSRPCGLHLSEAHLGSYPEALRMVTDKLLDLLDSQLHQDHINWRTAFMVNLELFILPPLLDVAGAARLAGQAVHLLLCQLNGQRLMARALLNMLLKEDRIASWRTEELKVAIQEAVRGALRGIPDFGSKLLALLAHAHPQQSATSNTAREWLANFQSMSPDEQVAMRLESFLQDPDHQFLWGRPVPAAMMDRSVIGPHTTLIRTLMQWAPEETLAVFRPVLIQTLTEKEQDKDRPATCAAIEATAGLLAIDAAFIPQGSEQKSAWDAWLKELLQSGLQAAPFDLAESWATGLRRVVSCLYYTQSPYLGRILSLVAERPQNGLSTSTSTVKRLKVIFQILAELSHRGVSGSLSPPSSPAAKAGRTFQRRVLEELPGLMATTANSVRQEAAKVSTILLASLLWERPPSLKDHERGLKAHPLSDDDFSRMGSSSGDSSPMEIDTADPDAILLVASKGKTLHQATLEFRDSIVSGMEAGVAAVSAKSDEREPGSLDVKDPRVAQLAFAIDFFRQAIDAEEGVALRVLHPTLFKMLPSLLKIQDLINPELQHLVFEAKLAVASFKYIAVPPHLTSKALAAVQDATNFDAWAARGAALAFLQYFWFRHVFLFRPEESSLVEQLVMSSLADSKLEVQEMAAMTLSGLLKGVSDSKAAALRSQLLEQHSALFPARKNRRDRTKSEPRAAEKIAEKHAVVLGLKACVLSAPYDVPCWLPDVLLALVRSSSEPIPIRDTARKAIAEFRRTHEEAQLGQVRSLLTEDQWEALLDVVSPSSYFA